MRRARLVLSVSLVTLLSGLLGCDVAVVAILAARGNKKNNSTSTPPPPDLSYALWVANFATPADATAAATALTTNGGNPSNPPWSFVGQATATQIWKGLPAGKNSILIQGPLTQAYNIDTFESLDANDAVVEVPLSTNVYANSAVDTAATPLKNGSGMLDGVPVTTLITDSAHTPCVFALFSKSVSSARVRLWGASQAAGDCVWTAHQELTNSIVVGGAAANSTGTIYTTFVDPSASPSPQSWLMPFNPNGSAGSLFSVSTNASPSGGISVAVDATDNLFMASNLPTGQIQLQKYAGGATPAQWPAQFIGVGGGGTNSVGPHGLAVASNVPLLASSGTMGTAIFIAAGQGTTGSHTMARFDDTPNLTPPPPFVGTQVWGPVPLADPASKSTTWSGVATSGSSNVLITGNLSNTGSGNIEILTENRAMDTGTVLWPSPITTTGGGASTNNGNAIGADGQGFAYVAGNFGSAVNGKDSVLLRYKVSDGSGLTTLYHNGAGGGAFDFAGANEFLDIAVDTDGTAYVVGYVTQSNLVSTTAAGAVTSWWIGKFPPGALVPIWTATFNFGVGNDQALNVSICGNFVYVVGPETFTGPKTGLRVLKFVK